MLSRVKWTLFLSIAAALVAGACSSDSGITDPGSDALAEHFDSLYLVAFHSQAFGEAGHAAQLTILEAGAAFGGRRTQIAMRTKTGFEQWNGVEYEIIRSPSASDYSLIAYRDAGAHTLLYLHYRKDGSLVSAQLTSSDSVYADATGSGAASTTIIDGQGCSDPSAALQNAVMASFANEECSIVKFQSSASLDVESVTGIDPALGHLEFKATFTGERFSDPGSTGALTSSNSKVAIPSEPLP